MKVRKYKRQRDFTELGDLLKCSREKAGLTQRQVSNELEYSSAQFISNFERGITAPPLKRLNQIIELFGVPVGRITNAYMAGVAKRVGQELGAS